MSAENKQKAKNAQEYLRRAKKNADAAADQFKEAGDPEGVKVAKRAADAAADGVDYVDSRLEPRPK